MTVEIESIIKGLLKTIKKGNHDPIDVAKAWLKIAEVLLQEVGEETATYIKSQIKLEVSQMLAKEVKYEHAWE